VMAECSTEAEPAIPERGVWLVTGGAGGLGRVFARWLAEEAKARIVLVGRSAENESIAGLLEELRERGGEAVYVRGDVGLREDVHWIVAQAREKFGRLDGILHAAGVIGRGALASVTMDEIRSVLAAKVRGSVYLDEATTGDPPAWFVVFSSLAALVGLSEAGGYAAANGFLDAFAEWRQGAREGRTLSINWPQWQGVGMRFGDAALERRWENWLRSAQGIVPMDPATGVRAIKRALGSGATRCAVVLGEAEKLATSLRRGMGLFPANSLKPTESERSAGHEGGMGEGQLVEMMKGHIRALLQVRERDLDPEVNLTEFGFDSITLKALAQKLSQQLGVDVSPSLFFAHPTMAALSRHLLEAHPAMKEFERGPAPKAEVLPPGRSTAQVVGPAGSGPADAPIAIVGMHGILPGSPDLAAFWRHLANGDDLITEIPAERWDATAYFGDITRALDKTNSKWGGFIAGVDRFDARFFGISPREAELMDPQHRLFLEVVWRTLEAAGESPSGLSGRRVGVFAGVQFNDFQEVLARAGASHAFAATGNGHAMMVNRVSYLLNLRGPSEAIDTACSSSLVALNRAVQALRRGECEAALVGGVSLLLSPGTYLAAGQMGVLSPTGRCRTFDASADGYVKGEGVAALYLMPLATAQRGGYPIAGLIRGIAVNHGGRAQSLTAPNREAQREVVVEACRSAGVDPATIGYIEAHGTATELGDPVEVDALRDAFDELAGRIKSGLDATKRPAWCGLGSVKSNIGHLEPAAGIAGVIKVLLAMRHQVLPATLHFQKLNPFIRLEGSPFYVVEKNQPWEAPKDAQRQMLPRRAGVSSFGYGGANAHVLLEEAPPAAAASDSRKPAYLATLSAKTETALRSRAAELDAWLRNQGNGADIASVCYTLNAGRAHFQWRCAVVVSSVEELRSKLVGELSARQGVRSPFVPDESIERLSTLQSESEYRAGLERLAEFYLQGGDLNWGLLHRDEPRRRIELPGYPFERQRHWPAPASGAGEIACDTTDACQLTLHEPCWIPEPLGRHSTIPANGTILVIGTDDATFGVLASAWAELGSARVVRLVSSADAARRGETSVAVRLDDREAIETFVRGLQAQDRLPVAIVWRLTAPPDGGSSADLTALFYPVQRLAQALVTIAPTQPVRWLLWSVRNSSEPDSPSVSAFSAWLQTLRLEHPKHVGCWVCLVSGTEPWRFSESDAARLLAEVGAAEEGAIEVRWRDSVREAKRFRPIAVGTRRSGSALAPWRERGVYLISGGGGGLGLVLAEFLARRAGARLVLVGRSELDAGRLRRLEQIRALGAEVEYWRGDVANTDEVTNMIRKAKGRFGAIHGVIHAAGVIDDAFLTRKSDASVRAVLAPKIAGVVALDKALASEPLDFFVLMSSVSVVWGSAGQCDYAYANAFLDGFAQQREALRAAGRRHGRTLSLNWPLWADGGMTVDGAIIETMKDAHGLVPLPAAVGTEALEECLLTNSSQILVLYGVPRRGAASGGKTASAGAEFDAGSLLFWLRTIYAEESKLPLAEVTPDESFGVLGINSILVHQLNRRLASYFPAFSRTVFYEHENLRSVAARLAWEYPGVVSETTASSAKCDESSKPIPLTVGPSLPMRAHDGATDDIAIIGLSGRYPGAPTLEAFWRNLRNGVESITEIPADRWDWRQHAGTDPAAVKQGKSYCRWGAFLEGVDQFDPLLFRISPRDAETIDPQERLFLQIAWATVEDAGYSPEGLNEIARRRGGKVGVFAGVTKNSYLLHGPEQAAQGNPVFPSSLPWSIANRISYTLDLRGPSWSVDTACSSSLTAIHQACESLRRSECAVALAGGVNLYLHPSTFAGLCQLGMLSTDGKNRSFGAGGQGFVPGEGVGAVLLKPLRAAEADGDHIYGVIKGSAVNHGGATSGYTVPNPVAQAEVVREALDRAGVDPREVSYVEAHGTGTALGDPIEVAGLTKALGTPPSDGPRCALGSVKSNIGHLEAAAGIAGLTKILLQMRHRELAPTLNAVPANPDIDFERSPLKLQTELAPWVRIRRALAGGERDCPLLAGISSFGAGGANAHLVVEEYRQPATPAAPEEPVLMILSARTDECLKESAEKLANWLETHPEANLADVAYTLQVGRQIMEERVAIMVRSRGDATTALRRFGCSKADEACVARNGGDAGAATVKSLLTGEEGRVFLAGVFARRDWEKLGRLWVDGAAVDWASLYTGREMRRVSLPTYPFARERYWIATRNAGGISPVAPDSPGPSSMESLLSRPRMNRGPESRHLLSGPAGTLSSAGSGGEGRGEATAVSTPFMGSGRGSGETSVETTLSTDLFFVDDHRLNGAAVLPGAAYLEIARAAAERQTSGRSVNRIRDVIWARPVLVADQPVTLETVLHPTQGAVHFEFYTVDSGDRRWHGQGELDWDAPTTTPLRRDLGALQSRMRRRFDAETIYLRFREMGLAYGPRLRRLEWIALGENEALIRIRRADTQGPDAGYILHPGVLDNVFQSVIAFALEGGAGGPAALPFSVDEVCWLGALPEDCHVYLRPSEEARRKNLARYDMDVMDDAGTVVGWVRGFTAPLSEASQTGLRLFTPAWVKAEARAFRPGGVSGLIMFDEDDLRVDQVRQVLGPATPVIQVKPGDCFAELAAGRFVINPTNGGDFSRLLAALTNQSAPVSHVLQCWTLGISIGSDSDDDTVKRCLAYGFHADVELLRAWLRARGRGLTLVHVCPSILGGFVAGLGRTARLEMPDICYRVIEVRGFVNGNFAKCVLAELGDIGPDGVPEVIWDGPERRVKRLQLFSMSEASSMSPGLRQSGVYVITGGWGG
ncbi:MAG: SDR family NAD(P)-dependent oxidoreductase, partial [Verrucomicrobia bacterium]|nr:SDR family NAD(P)-dependent oxidoreductase [Verrucomicrobiota bacterium]